MHGNAQNDTILVKLQGIIQESSHDFKYNYLISLINVGFLFSAKMYCISLLLLIAFPQQINLPLFHCFFVSKPGCIKN